VQHRIHNLEGGVKILGLGLGDLAIIVLTWFITFQVFGAALDARPRFIVGIGVTFLVYRVWSLVKDRVPSHFGFHFIAWLGERQQYEVTHDIEPAPYLIDVRTVDELRRRQKRADTLVRHATRRRRGRGQPTPGEGTP
jgi:hypothetical protein